MIQPFELISPRLTLVPEDGQPTIFVGQLVQQETDAYTVSQFVVRPSFKQRNRDISLVLERHYSALRKQNPKLVEDIEIEYIPARVLIKMKR